MAINNPAIPRPARWKDPNILIGLGGVVATIVVGVLTYWLTAGSSSREYQERLNAAHDEVLAVISRTIAEDVVPGKDEIQDVLNSVRRQYGIKEQDSYAPDSVVEDLLTKVLANEFLDAKRREELSAKLVALKSNPAETRSVTPAPSPVNKDEARLMAVTLALATSGIMAVLTLFLLQRRLVGTLSAAPFVAVAALAALLVGASALVIPLATRVNPTELVPK